MTTEAWNHLSAALREEVESHLHEGETPRAWFEPDLDARQHYAQGLVVLTDRRLLAVEGRTASDASPPVVPTVQIWALTDALTLQLRDFDAAGVLELVDASGRLGQWRYTSALAARRFWNILSNAAGASCRKRAAASAAGRTCQPAETRWTRRDVSPACGPVEEAADQCPAAVAPFRAPGSDDPAGDLASYCSDRGEPDSSYLTIRFWTMCSFPTKAANQSISGWCPGIWRAGRSVDLAWLLGWAGHMC